MKKFSLLYALAILTAWTAQAYTGSPQFDSSKINTAKAYTRDYVLNPSAFVTTASSSASGATLARDASTNPIDGLASWTCDGTAQNDYCEWTLDTVNPPDTSGNCQFSGVYLGDATKYDFAIVDGSGTTLASTAIGSASGLMSISSYGQFSVNYPCGASGARKVRLIQTQTGDGAAVQVGRLYYGAATNIGTVAQASFWGSIKYASAANCDWTTGDTGGAFQVFAADTDCGTPTVTGFASAPGTKIPGITFSSLPPGEYQVIETASNSTQNATTASSHWYQMYDGSTGDGNIVTRVYSNPPFGQAGTINGRFSYSTAQGSKTFQVRAGSDSNNNDPTIYNSGSLDAFEIRVYRFPSASETITHFSNLAWRVDANISGANPSLGTSAVTSYTGIEDSGLTLTNNSGNGVISAQIPCSGTNAPSGTTCAAGNESVGVSFTLPQAQDVLACISFSHDVSTGATGVLRTTFQIVETPNNAQTISQEGKSRVGSGIATASSNPLFPYRICGTFTFSSAGQKTLRLMYEQSVTATVTSSLVLADANSSNGQRDIHWEVYPVNSTMAAPVLIGSVTSSSPGVVRVDAAEINCDASSSITAQSGAISSIGNRSTTSCALTLVTGAFSAAPYACNVTVKSSTVQAMSCSCSSATSCTVYGPSADYDAYVTLVGPR